MLSLRERVPARDPPDRCRAPDLTPLCHRVIRYLQAKGVDLEEFCSKVMDVQSPSADLFLRYPEPWSSLSVATRLPYIHLLRWCALPEDRKLSKLRQASDGQEVRSKSRRSLLHQLAAEGGNGKKFKKKGANKEPSDIIVDTAGVARAFVSDVEKRGVSGVRTS